MTANSNLVEQENLEAPKLTLYGHIRELRRRLLLCLAIYLLAVSICFVYAETIYQVLARPLLAAYATVYSDTSHHKLIFTGLTEGFFAYVRVSLYAGFALSFPIIALQLYRFIAPGLYKRERRAIIPFLLIAPILFLCGASLVYFGVMPTAWRFFLSFERPGGELPIILEARISEYLDLTLEMMVGFGLAFQMPIVLGLLAKFGLVTASSLAQKRRYAIVGIFILAALLTPPDVLSQVALAIPLLILYEISIWLVRRMQATYSKFRK